MKPCTFQSMIEKLKKNPPRENFLYFRKRKPRKSVYIFSKESFFYILGNGNAETETLKKLHTFQEVTCKARKTNKKYSQHSSIIWPVWLNG